MRASVGITGERYAIYNIHSSPSWPQIPQIRNYRLGPGNKLQEYVYLSKDGNTWRCAALHDLNVVLDSSSSIAVGLTGPGGYLIGIHYQGQRLFP